MDKKEKSSSKKRYKSPVAAAAAGRKSSPKRDEGRGSTGSRTVETYGTGEMNLSQGSDTEAKENHQNLDHPSLDLDKAPDSIITEQTTKRGKKPKKEKMTFEKSSRRKEEKQDEEGSSGKRNKTRSPTRSPEKMILDETKKVAHVVYEAALFSKQENNRQTVEAEDIFFGIWCYQHKFHLTTPERMRLIYQLFYKMNEKLLNP